MSEELFDSWQGKKFFSSLKHPYQLWDLLNLPYDRYWRLFLWAKTARL
jgi:hypothetical protein